MNEIFSFEWRHRTRHPTAFFSNIPKESLESLRLYEWRLKAHKKGINRVLPTDTLSQLYRRTLRHQQRDVWPDRRSWIKAMQDQDLKKCHKFKKVRSNSVDRVLANGSIRNGDASGRNVAWLFAAVYWSLHQPEMNAQNIYKFAFLTTEHESCQMNASAAITKSRSMRPSLNFFRLHNVLKSRLQHNKPLSALLRAEKNRKQFQRENKRLSREMALCCTFISLFGCTRAWYNHKHHLDWLVENITAQYNCETFSPGCWVGNSINNNRVKSHKERLKKPRNILAD